MELLNDTLEYAAKALAVPNLPLWCAPAAAPFGLALGWAGARWIAA